MQKEEQLNEQKKCQQGLHLSYFYSGMLLLIVKHTSAFGCKLSSATKVEWVLMVVIVAGNLRPRYFIHFGTLAQRYSFFAPVLQISAGCCSQTHILVSDSQTCQRSSLTLSLWFWYTIQDKFHGVQLKPLRNSISQNGESQMRYYKSLINIDWSYDQLLNLCSKVRVTFRLLRSQSLLWLNPGSKVVGSGPV